jgi:hypothetical protein
LDEESLDHDGERDDPQEDVVADEVAEDVDALRVAGVELVEDLRTGAKRRE